MTASGEWAGCGSPYQFEPTVHRGDMAAHDMEFVPEVSFSTAGMTESEIREKFPAEYFRFDEGKAVCMKGNSAAELFEVKKNGVLKARGLF